MADDLLEKAKAGDKEAIAQIYENYRSLIYGYAFKIFKNPDDAEEIVSRTFEKFLTLLPTLRSGTLAGWLFIVARNEVMEIHRERAKTSENIEEVEKSPKEELFQTKSNPEELLAQKRDWEELIKGLVRLPKDYEMVLVSYYLEGYEIKEIAQKLGKSEKAVRQILARGREELRTILKDSPWLRKRYNFIGGQDERKK